MKKTIILLLLIMISSFVFAENSLLEGAMYRDFDKIKMLIENGWDVDTTSSDGFNTALILSAQRGELKIVKYLVEHGANIKKRARRGMTSLMYAAEYRHLEVVKYLVSKGADVNAKDNDGNRTVLIHAIEGNDYKVVKYLIEKGARVNTSTDRDITALMWASRKKDNLEIIKLLLDKGAKINAKDDDNSTALIRALGSNGNHAKMAELLIERGANVNIVSKYSHYTAFKVAIMNEHYDIAVKMVPKLKNVNGLEDEVRKTSFLMYAVEKGSLKVVKALVEKRAKLNQQNTYNETALIKAASNGDIEIVKYLVSKGADFTIKDRNGETALMRAARSGVYNSEADSKYSHVIKYLVSKGADINQRNRDGNTALILVSKKNKYVELSKELIGYGANINFANKNSITALSYAMDYENDKLVKILKENGAVTDVKFPPSQYGIKTLKVSKVINIKELNSYYKKSNKLKIPARRIKAESSTFLKDEKYSYPAKNAVDADVNTSWAEGVNGFGRHEWVKVSVDLKGLRGNICKLIICPGYSKSKNQFLKNNRLKSVYYKDLNYRRYMKLDFDDKYGYHEFDIEVSKRQKLEFKLYIDQVYKGEKDDDTCIGEIILIFDYDAK